MLGGHLRHMFSISSTPLDLGALARELRDQQAGAYVSFEGWVRNRNDGRPVQGLEYEAYVPLAEKEGGLILSEARAKFAVLDVRAVHRTGVLALGELAVWVGVTSAHRDAAFAACRYVIDEAKTRVPIWKRERYADGSTTWINCAAPLNPPRPGE